MCVNIGEAVGDRVPRVFLEWEDGSYISTEMWDFQVELGKLVEMKGAPVKVEYREYCWSKASSCWDQHVNHNPKLGD